MDPMRSEDWVRRCESVVADLDVPTPFDLSEFCVRLERRRGRRICLVGIFTAPESPCGLWVALPDVDVIFHEAHTTALHRDHIALHEIGHMLRDHQGGPALGPGITDALLPHLDPEMVSRVLGRTAYTAVEEREAELIASMILERASRATGRKLSDPTTEPEVATVMHRVESVFAPSLRG